MSQPLLVTLLPSTDVDLGRWLLSHYGVSYRERPHAPIFHVLALKSWGVSAEGYPLLVSADRGTKSAGIQAILDQLELKAAPDKRLWPDKMVEPERWKEVDTLQHDARFGIGTAVVQWSYWNLLKYKPVVWPSLTTGVPWYETLTLRLAFPVIRSLMYKGLKLDQSVADSALETIHAGFDRLDARLSDGRRYLVGETLTFADLATAASLAPMVLAQGYHGMLPLEARCPVFMQEIYKPLRQRPTGRYIQRIYDTHRAAQLLQLR
ncbi:glutathione S-transferase C-terminal domain-containing protein [Salipiger bermudensis]|uniref:glutathione S-transferase C-terminal domain-containing protein n=1 Tax=Salipiger bermudensis TaxID=344736 RepID=UPI001CD1DAB8|nr:glutathione S-transferase C-terminal domain-containing protein [Salipiger bermudensis]MCA1284207.1 glutathione S-transferase C-terminal domain-containing protein [Salipiger bermudensis]